MGQWNSEARA